MSVRNQMIRLAQERSDLRAEFLPMLRVGKEFPTDKALQDYLEAHPKADKSNHWVAEPGEGSTKDEEPKSEDKPKSEESKKAVPAKTDKAVASLFKKMKGIGKSMREAISGAPAKIKQFVVDAETRKSYLQSIAKKAKESPEKVSKRVYEAAKSELKEIKRAGQALRKVAGKPPQSWTKQDKKAVYSAAVYVAGTVLAASGGGALVAAGALGKSFVMHVAVKAVSHVFDRGVVHLEAGEQGHHAIEVFQHLITASESEDYEKSMITHLTAAVGAVLAGGVSDEEMESILKGTKEPDYEDMESPKMSKKASDPEEALRQATIRLAHANPVLRPYLLAALREASYTIADRAREALQRGVQSPETAVAVILDSVGLGKLQGYDMNAPGIPDWTSSWGSDKGYKVRLHGYPGSYQVDSDGNITPGA